MRFFYLILFLIYAKPGNALNLVIDPGHGGNDRGASSGKISESQITLQLSNLIKEALKDNTDFNVILTRTSDTYLTLEERAEFANKNADLFLSIHTNASSDKKVRGKEIYFQNQLAASDEALFLANRENALAPKNLSRSEVEKAAIKMNFKNTDVRAIVEDLERNNNFKLSGKFAEFLISHVSTISEHGHSRIRQAPFYVVSNVSKPSVLIEVGYLSNAEEAKNLSDPAFQKTMAQNIVFALLEFKKFMDKSVHKSLD